MAYNPYILKKELVRRKKYEIYRKYPELWLRDVLGEDLNQFKWSKNPKYVDHKWDGHIDPLHRAWRSLCNKKWVSLQSATATGKTYFLARVALWFADCFENSLVVTSAPTGKQLERNLWGELSYLYDKFKETRPYLRTTKLRIQVEGENPYSKYRTTHEIYGMTAGVSAAEDSAVKAQGIHRKDLLIILEEATGINDKIATAFKNTAMNSSDSEDEGRNLILAVGNPDHPLDLLNTLAKLSVVDHYTVSAYDHPNVVTKKNIIPGAVTLDAIQRRREEYGVNSSLYLSRVRGKTPVEGENTLIRMEWLNKADKYHPDYDDESLIQDDSYNSIGIDVANSENGDMASVVATEANVFTYVKEFQCPNASVLAQNLIYDNDELFKLGISNYNLPTVKECNVIDQCIAIDAVGVGVATVNKFLEHNYDVLAIMGGAKPIEEAIPKDNKGNLLYSFQNLRSQMYWQLREDFRQGLIFFDIADRLLMDKIKGELTLIKFILSDRHIKIEGKEHIKKRLGKSPNIADALVYANWARNGYMLATGGLPIG